MNRTIKRLSILLFFAIISVIAVQAATITPSNKYVTRKVTSGAFTALRTNSSVDITYTVGPRSIEVYAPDNLINYIKVTLKGGELIVGYTENMNIKGKHKSCVRVSAPDVKDFTVASSGDITIKSPIKQPGATIKLTSQSAGDIESLGIEARKVCLTANSAGDIDTKNIKAESVDISANSAGDIETGNVDVTNDATIHANSAGDIDIPQLVAGVEIKVSANSAGDIEINAVNTERASFVANSAGGIEVKDVKANEVIGMANSTGSVTLAGNCATASLASTSTGTVNAASLKANDVTASVYSVGKVVCRALKSLNAERKGMGTIKYAGNPSNITVDDARGGGVSRL